MDDAVKPQGCTNFKLRQLMRRVGQLYDVELAQAGLRTTQYSLLSHVVKLAPVRPVDLARAMKMDASTLTRNLRPLVDAGWVTLDAGPDARSRFVNAGRCAERRWDGMVGEIPALPGRRGDATKHLTASGAGQWRTNVLLWEGRELLLWRASHACHHRSSRPNRLGRSHGSERPRAGPYAGPP